MQNIEQLEKDVNEIKNSLNALKNNVSLSENEKRSQAQTLKSYAETTRENIQSKIDSLKNKTDDESTQEIEKAQILLDSVNETFNLYDSILDSSKAQPTQELSQNDKNIFIKAKNWIGNQWNDIRNGDKWKEERGKNLLRTAGFGVTGAGTVALAYKGIKKLFGKDKQKENKSDNSKESKEGNDNKGFWDRWYGKALKWSIIGTPIYYITHGASTGKWSLKDAFKWGKQNSENPQIEILQQGGDTISEDMLQELLKMEGSQNFVAKIHKKNFGESFVTGPYGMVYKHIDMNGNLLKKPIPFKNGERVTKDWAEKNARAYYNKKAKEWSDLLKKKGYTYTQDMLDALVCASGGTAKSVQRLKNYVLSHRDDKDAIFDFMSKFATTAAGNGKVMPGLVSRRRFEANWFAGTKRPYSDYQNHLA